MTKKLTEAEKKARAKVREKERAAAQKAKEKAKAQAKAAALKAKEKERAKKEKEKAKAKAKAKEKAQKAKEKEKVKVEKVKVKVGDYTITAGVIGSERKKLVKQLKTAEDKYKDLEKKWLVAKDVVADNKAAVEFWQDRAVSAASSKYGLKQRLALEKQIEKARKQYQKAIKDRKTLENKMSSVKLRTRNTVERIDTKSFKIVKTGANYTLTTEHKSVNIDDVPKNGDLLKIVIRLLVVYNSDSKESYNAGSNMYITIVGDGSMTVEQLLDEYLNTAVSELMGNPHMQVYSNFELVKIEVVTHNNALTKAGAYKPKLSTREKRLAKKRK